MGLPRIRPRTALVLAALALLPTLYYPEIAFLGRILASYDVFVYFYPLYAYAAETLRAGRLPLWNPYLFLGAPFLANPQMGVFYPPNLIFLLVDPPRGYAISLLLHLGLTAAATYAFARRALGLGQPAACLASLAFTFGGFLTGQSGHLNQVQATAWLPVVLLLADEALQPGRRWWCVPTGVALGVQLLAGHAQETYMTGVAMGLLALYRCWQPRRMGQAAPGAPAASAKEPLARFPTEGLVTRLLGSALALGVAAGVAVGLAAVQLVPTLELAGLSIRGGGLDFREATAFSLPPTLALRGLMPGYGYGHGLPTTEYLGYVGVVPLGLALVAAAVAPWRRVALPMALAGVGLALALGRYNPLAPLLYEVVPGLGLFRVPARWLFVGSFGLALLAAEGLQAVEGGLRARWWHGASGAAAGSGRGRIASAARVVAVLAGAGLVAVGLLLVAEPIPRGLLALWGALGGLTLAFGLWAVGPGREPPPPSLPAGVDRARLVVSVVVALVAGELWLGGSNLEHRYAVPPEVYRQPRASTELLQADEGFFRVLSVSTEEYEIKEAPDYRRAYDVLPERALFNFLVAAKLNEILTPNVPLLYGLATPDGYDGGVLPLRRYVRFQEVFLPSDRVSLDGVVRRRFEGVPDPRVLDLLGVRYVLANKLHDTTVDGLPFDRAMTVRLLPGQRVVLQRLPGEPITAVAALTAVEGADVPLGTPVARLVVEGRQGAVHHDLRLGQETGALPPAPDAADTPRLVPPFREGLDLPSYFARLPVDPSLTPTTVRVESLLAEGTVVLRGLTLVDDHRQRSWPLVLDDRLELTPFFDIKVYRYGAALPPVHVVHRAEVVADDEETLRRLREPSFDPRRTVLLADGPGARPLAGAAEPPPARVVVREAERLVVEVDLAEDGYLVVGETDYPGWEARVDGQVVPLVRANYLFKAVPVPAGSHRVELVYRPRSVALGGLVSGATLALLLGLALWQRAARRR